MIPTHLPNCVVRVDKIDPHVNATFTGVKVRGCDCTARRSLVKDGSQFLIPSGMGIICSLDKLQIVGLEPDPMSRRTPASNSNTSARKRNSKVCAFLPAVSCRDVRKPSPKLGISKCLTIPHILLYRVISFLGIDTQLQRIRSCQKDRPDSRVRSNCEFSASQRAVVPSAATIISSFLKDVVFGKTVDTNLEVR
ncbi:unnamed protein product [Aspergillus oryzae]|nr:unnamed protein product [Aspergillus oryzae]